MDQSDDFQRFFKANVILSSAFVASLFIYLFIAEIIRAKFKPFLGFVQIPDFPFLRYFFYALAILTVIINRVLNSMLLKKAADEDIPKAILRLHRATIISLSLSEVPSLLGLVLFLFNGLIKDLYALLFVSIILEFIYFPRRKNWEDYLKKIPFSCRIN